MDQQVSRPVASPPEQIAELLGDIASAGSFSARRTAPAAAIAIDVRGVGPLRLPVSRDQARQLRAIARPARFGRRTETLLDRRVRDTGEIPLSRVKIDTATWNKTLRPILDGLRADLGLADGSRLQAELHSMLVYGRGQFFVPHQDSEKTDDMVASLVVMLPSESSGGTLVVEHHGTVASYRGSKRVVSCVAFYADCRHEIRPVRSGHRIVLTYNLRLRGASRVRPVPVPAVTVDAVTGALRRHFETPVSRRFGAGVAAPPVRLIYMLDHSYTERGLSWTRLKGDDAVRATAITTAADRADCDVALALADVHEIWSAFDDDWDSEWSYHERSGWFDDDDDADDDEPSAAGDDDDDYRLDELLDSEITLDRWLHPSGQLEPIGMAVTHAEACSSTPSSSLRPYHSEYEPYMGNYGNTLDRWYRRAAVVVWPRDRGFAVRAEASPRWAVDQLAGLVGAGDVATACERAAALSPFWTSVALPEPHDDVGTAVLSVAASLEHAELAAMLLERFDIDLVVPANAKPLVALAERYGEPWTARLLAGWADGRRPWESGRSIDSATWIATLPSVCAALLAVDRDGGTRTGRLLLDDAWRRLGRSIDSASTLLPPSRRIAALSDLVASVVGVLSASAMLGSDRHRDDVVRALGGDDEAMVGCAVAVLRDAMSRDPSPVTWEAGLADLRASRIRAIRARVDRPERADDDWSVPAPAGCSCPDCGTLAGFLGNATRRQLEWPLAKDRRSHIHRVIDSHELPVRHSTKRTGRPYKLVLTKTDALFSRERDARRRDERDLAWLTQLDQRADQHRT